MAGTLRYPPHTRSTRLMAMLLAVLLLVASQPGHAAMDDSCAVDCGASQVDMLDHSGAVCGACAALSASPFAPRVPPDALADLSDPAVVEFIAPPPREPPKS